MKEEPLGPFVLGVFLSCFLLGCETTKVDSFVRITG